MPSWSQSRRHAICVTLSFYHCHRLSNINHILFMSSSSYRLLCYIDANLGHCIVIILSSIKRAYGALVPSCHLLLCLHCETTAARPSWLCHHRNSSYVMRLSSWRRRKATVFVEFSWYSHRRAIVVIHSWSSHCPPTVVLPSSSLHRHYALAVIPLLSCRHHHDYI